MKNYKLLTAIIMLTSVSTFASQSIGAPELSSFQKVAGINVSEYKKYNYTPLKPPYYLPSDVKTNIVTEYANLKFESYNEGLNFLLKQKKLYEASGFNEVDSCSAIRCGNTIELAEKIDSNNPISEKSKQEYFLLYGTYSWISFHLASFENSTFLFMRNVLLEDLHPHKKMNSKTLIGFSKSDFSLNSKSTELIDSQLSDYLDGNSKIFILGHASNVGDDLFNFNLAKRRAHEVYDYLINKGVAKERLKIMSLGEKAPVSFLKSKEGIQMNQSVEIITI